MIDLAEYLNSRKAFSRSREEQGKSSRLKQGIRFPASASRGNVQKGEKEKEREREAAELIN